MTKRFRQPILYSVHFMQTHRVTSNSMCGIRKKKNFEKKNHSLLFLLGSKYCYRHGRLVTRHFMEIVHVALSHTRVVCKYLPIPNRVRGMSNNGRPRRLNSQHARIICN